LDDKGPPRLARENATRKIVRSLKLLRPFKDTKAVFDECACKNLS
jgi:hypothetical protein